MKSRIAIFEGYGAPFGRSSQGRSSLGRPLGRSPFGRRPSMGRPLSMGRPSSLSDLGRRAYYVPPERGYGPLREGKRAYPIVRKGFKVRKMKDTPAMKRAQARFKKAAKKCSRRRKGSFQTCMRKALKSKR